MMNLVMQVGAVAMGLDAANGVGVCVKSYHQCQKCHCVDSCCGHKHDTSTMDWNNYSRQGMLYFS